MLIFFTVVGLVSVFGNIIVLIVVRKSKELSHSQYIYKCSIAVSDILWGVIISVFIIWKTLVAFSMHKIKAETSYTVPEIIKDENEITYKFQVDYITDYNASMELTHILFYIAVLAPISLFVSFITFCRRR